MLAATQYTEGVKVTPSTLPVLVGRLPRRIPVSLIIRIEADGSYCRIHTSDGNSYLTGKRLNTLAPNFFWRVHRSHLVNPHYVKGSLGLLRHEGFLRLVNGELLPVARRLREGIYQRLKQLPC